MLSLVGSYTAPTYNDINFTLCSGYTAPTYDSINFTLGVNEYCDTCTCSGLNRDWGVDMSDYCIIEDDCDLGTGELSFTGAGNFTCDAKIEITDMGDIDNGIMIINDECRIIIE